MRRGRPDRGRSDRGRSDGGRSDHGQDRRPRDHLSADHGGQSVRLEFHNLGTMPCDLVIVLTSLPADALPVKDGRVDVPEDGSGPVRNMSGGEFPDELQPGAAQTVDLGLESIPATDDRVVLCNGAGDYQRGRSAASLRFDR